MFIGQKAAEVQRFPTLDGKVTTDIDVSCHFKRHGNRGNTNQILADCIEQMTERGRLAMGRTNLAKRFVYLLLNVISTFYPYW